ncbi:hypothetical protein [Latilactobacillus curvatus]
MTEKYILRLMRNNQYSFNHFDHNGQKVADAQREFPSTSRTGW